MHQEVHNCSRGVSIKNYEPCIEKSDWSIQTSHGRITVKVLSKYLHHTFNWHCGLDRVPGHSDRPLHCLPSQIPLYITDLMHCLVWMMMRIAVMLSRKLQV